MSDDFSSLGLRDESEGLFARDVNGQLIRMMPVVAADFEKDVALVIDGQSVTVKKAVPATDSPSRLIPSGGYKHDPPRRADRFRAAKGFCVRAAS